MDEIIRTVRSRNATVDEMMSSVLTLDGHIDHEIQKLSGNNEFPLLSGREDLISFCEDYLAERLGADAAERASAVLQKGILYTANHLGGLYSAQSFQGDLIYARLLGKLFGGAAPSVPMMSFGLVPINSSTYARGLIAYSRTDGAEHIPLLPKMPTNAAASLSDAFTSAMARSTKDKALANVRSYLVKKQIRSVMESLYQSPQVLGCRRFADQVIYLGEGLYDRLYGVILQGKFWHMEAETVFAGLFEKDFGDHGSLVYHILSDEAAITALNEATDDEGRKLSSLLFRGCASDRKCFGINLDADGHLRGRDISGGCLDIDIRSDGGSALTDAVKARKVMPHVYLSWFMSSYVRGFSWYGGILQSQYLRGWRRSTCEMLRDAGYADAVGPRGDFDDSGYLSGPIYMLFDTGDGAVNAGPFEMMAKPPAPEAFDRLFGETDMKSAHEMGCFEFYNDITDADEKGDNWYERIAVYAKEHYGKYTLQNLQGC
ncbi:MAG: hypothetical protein K6G58_02090 [Lachnospiraceae bacterium]|nr:hypothetical protein [Lachnospiraceae bacterium]